MLFSISNEEGFCHLLNAEFHRVLAKRGILSGTVLTGEVTVQPVDHGDGVGGPFFKNGPPTPSPWSTDWNSVFTFLRV